MTARPENKLETHFEEYGSLAKPMIFGRIARFALGAWLLYFLYQLIAFGADILVDQTPPNSWSLWLVAFFGIWATPYVINIGFSRNWKHWPRVVVLAIGVVLVGIDLLYYGTWWATPLGVFTLVWFVYWTAHLGISLVLSALIATPGCEMRAIPHLWTLVSGHRTREHYCPGVFDSLDRWEREKNAA